MPGHYDGRGPSPGAADATDTGGGALGGSSRVRALKSLLHSNDGLRLAVNQVAQYCQKRGVPYATVCNGHQLVSFVATRLDGTPPLDGRALVFASLDDALSQYSLLSKQILQARYAALHHPEHGGPTTVQVANKGGISPHLFVDSLSRRPILLIGDVNAASTQRPTGVGRRLLPVPVAGR